MKISELARNDGRAGSNDAWLSKTFHESWRGDPKDNIRVIYHYAHRMLVFNQDDPADERVLDYDIGHGSISDQGGMNRLFQELNLPLYYSRAGGAKIVER